MMSASSERFELFQDDLEGLFDEIQENLELLSNKSRRRKKMTGEEKRQFARSCKVQIKEANKIIQEMEREAKMAPREYRYAYILYTTSLLTTVA